MERLSVNVSESSSTWYNHNIIASKYMSYACSIINTKLNVYLCSFLAHPSFETMLDILHNIFFTTVHLSNTQEIQIISLYKFKIAIILLFFKTTFHLLNSDTYLINTYFTEIPIFITNFRNFKITNIL